MRMSLARTIAHTLQAYQNCKADGNKSDWADEHRRRLEQMAADLLPSGSGIDNGTSINLEQSRPERIVLDTAFHHMDQGGGYDGWTEHQVIITASLVHGLSLRITGRNRNDIKDYLYDAFDNVLSADVDYSVQLQRYTPVAV